MKKEELEHYLNIAMSTGADFAELYLEKSESKTFRLVDSKLDSIESNNIYGLGIRIVKDDDCFYTSTNILDKENIEKIILKLSKNIVCKQNKMLKKYFLKDLVIKNNKPKIPHDEYNIEDKKTLLYSIDKTARDYSKLVSQVTAGIIEKDKEFTIANSKGKYITSNSCLTRIVSTVHVEKGELKENDFVDFASQEGYEILKKCNILELVKKSTETAIEKLDAKDFKGGEYPVIIAPGFGAVIFHEACGHGLEATSVAPHLSVFSDDLNKKVASEKVTLIDDGTLKKSWGSSKIDDEGNKTKKTILIENGFLRNFLVDDINAKKMHHRANGCGRRESYLYAPTSRMSNTYLDSGTDKVEDMIKSIKLGIYCEKMSGGSVNPATGDFNFAVDTARLIENGELKELLKGITLIGNSKDILKNVEMVSDDLKISAGYCGSKSGMIPVTIGQPTIKVSKILVGGKE